MATIRINFDKKLGRIKPMHAVGQPPFSGGANFSMFHYLTEAGIPYSRLHDVGGAYGNNRFVDIPNIFRDFDADENDPASYDFAFTDGLITALVNAGVEPFYRLGVTIENDSAIKAYRIYPPKDFAKWARICEHIIMHYTEGWADGFNYDIRYWEIWNEPDNSPDLIENQMWLGTKEEYFELYDVTAKHLKKRFPHLKIGGFASCGFYAIMKSYIPDAKSSPRREYFVSFFEEFLEYIKKSGAPLDFFSWHTYDPEIKNNLIYAKFARDALDRRGFTETETTCNEWNMNIRDRGTPRHSSLIGAMMLAFQKSELDSAMFYDARYGISYYGSLFNPLNAKPFPTYYAFTAFNRLYKLGDEIETEVDTEGVYAVGAVGEGGGCVVVANPGAEALPLELESERVPSRFVVTDALGNDRECAPSDTLPAESIVSIIFD